MSSIAHIQAKIQDWSQARHSVESWKAKGETVVFTNGCFDILHYGHVFYLAQARDLGRRLVIGLNSTDSVRRLKGPQRPINDQATRQLLLAALECVDAVVVFEEDTPLALIEYLMPDILVKGGDWTPDQIVGAPAVLANGGQVLSLPYIAGYSTTAIEQKIKSN